MNAQSVEDAAVLLTRAAFRMRQVAVAACTGDVESLSRHWFADEGQYGRHAVITEHEGSYIVQGVHAATAEHVARWDPATGEAVAGMLEHAARCVRRDGAVGDHDHALAVARSFLRSYAAPS